MWHQGNVYPVSHWKLKVETRANNGSHFFIRRLGSLIASYGTLMPGTGGGHVGQLFPPLVKGRTWRVPHCA